MKKLLVNFICLFALCLPAEASEKELECLAKVVYHEARGEPSEGQIAVAHVVMNRVAHDSFPDTICGVVRQKKQFSGFNKRKYFSDFKGDLWDNSMTSAVLVYLGKRKDNTNGALFYLNPKKVRKNVLTSWGEKYIVLKNIYNHRFYGIKA